MRVITASELVEILRKHKLWLMNKPGGEQADLSGASLSRADLSEACLSRANLYGANLSGADLSRANLYEANLYEASLSRANLSRANLSGANLSRANLSGASLSRADLSEACLSRANLYGANLSGAKCPLACPEEGSFIGFKKCRDDLIVKLEIPEDAHRCSATGRKCRCSKAKVLSITNPDGSEAPAVEAISQRDEDFVYRIGEVVSVDDFEMDRWKACSAGIHFFITRQEAVDY